MGDIGKSPDELTSTVPETPIEELDAPPGVLEAVELYESAAQQYAVASSVYVSSIEVVSSTSAVSPW